MKTRNPNTDRSPKEMETKRRGSSLNSFLGGAATVLVLLALGMGGYLLYRAIQLGQVKNPFHRQKNQNNTTVVPATPTPAIATPEASTEIPQNPYIQTALDNRAQVELISVMRVPEKPDEVNVEMRVRRLTETFAGNDMINVGATTARNPFTGETYEPVDPIDRSSGPIFLFSLRQNQTADGYVVLKVPAGVNTIDILVRNVGVFKNVLISNAASVVTPKPIIPTPHTSVIPTPTPTTNPTPSNNTANSNNNSSTKTPNTQVATPDPSTPTPSPKFTVEFQPGAFKQLAYGTKAEIELLSAKRTQDPQTGNRDVVNLQMRIRRLAANLSPNNTINVGETTARNFVTSETYKAVNPRENSTGSVSLSDIRSGASADAYVWLKVPPNVNILDIYIPETGAIRNVPISN